MSADSDEDGEKDDEEARRLDWKDYVAILVALLQTNLLPYVLLIAAIFLIFFVFQFAFRL